ncbi:uncharacterized protein LOC132703962 [Cylas formicarius]|uniref:uncharacterized protein LOC132703962 n=1 Tax=Cylas formicarius TaxID=197179 RepID=UPI00295863D3|nr:uncharacterized protein LOC132703962 [Cylas formicarius]
MADIKIANIEELIKNYISGVVIEENVTRLTAPGENYGSLMLKVDLKVRNGDGVKTYHLVAKCVPPNKTVQESFNTKETFRNEIAWYSTIIPTLQDFQREKGISNVMDFFAKYYGGRVSLDPDSEDFDEDGVLLVENLVAAGFQCEDRLRGFDLPTSKAIIKSIATLHSTAIALKLQKPHIFETNIKKYLFGHVQMEMGSVIFETPLEVIEEMTDLASVFPKVKEALKVNPFGREGCREPWASPVHTDLWMNNIMVNPEEPKVALVDLQTTKYKSAVCDLIFFLMTSVEIPLARKHLDELIALYYDEFISNLTALHADTSEFSHDRFMAELKMEAYAQFAHALFFAMVMSAQKMDDLADAGHEFMDQVIKFSRQVSPRHKEKYRFLVEEFTKRNWI